MGLPYKSKWILAILFLSIGYCIYAGPKQKNYFDIPSGNLEPALMNFASSAKVDLIFDPQIVATYRNKRIRGEFSNEEVLQRLLEGLPLEIIWDEGSQALAIRKKKDFSITENASRTVLTNELIQSSDLSKSEPLNMNNSTSFNTSSGSLLPVYSHFLRGVMLLLSTWGIPFAEGQTTAEESNPYGPIVDLPTFEVLTTESIGYVATNSATALKTNQSIMKIPQAVTVVTHDFIEDIGSFNTSDVLRYAGVATYFRGEAVSLRGTRIGYPMLDEMPESAPFLDNVTVDSYEIIKGPSSVLYGNRANLGGLVLKSSKKPLPYHQGSLTLKADQHGTYRAELDTTGPIRKTDTATLAYRFITAYQDGDTYYNNTQDSRKIFAPSLQLTTRSTIVRFQLDYQELTKEAQANNFVDTNGQLYTGAGREEKYIIPWNQEDSTRLGIRAGLLHRFSDEWDMKLQIGALQFDRNGMANSMIEVNIPAGTVTTRWKLNDIETSTYSSILDICGKYSLAGIPMQTNTGTYVDYRSNNQSNWSSLDWQDITRDINNPDFGSIPAPTIIERSGNPGNESDEWVSNTYLQQTIEVLPETLSIVAGGSFATSKTNRISNTSTGVVQTTEGQEYLYRLGFVYNPMDAVSIYAINTTTFTPISGSTLDYNGNLLDNQKGEGTEVGVKLALFDERLSATFSLFQIDLTNVAVLAGSVGDPLRPYYEPIGSTSQEGFDFDIAVAPVEGLQLTMGAYFGTVKDQNGERIGNSYKESMHFVARYDFPEEILDGFSIGTSAYHMGDRTIPVIYIYVMPEGKDRLWLDPYTIYSVFASYSQGNWSLQLNIENLTDEVYALGSQHCTCIDPGTPRTYSLKFSYRF